MIATQEQGMKNDNWILLVTACSSHNYQRYMRLFFGTKTKKRNKKVQPSNLSSFFCFYLSPTSLGFSLHLLKFFLAFVNVRYLPLTSQLKGAILTNYPNTIFLRPSVYTTKSLLCLFGQRPMNLCQTLARHFTITFVFCSCMTPPKNFCNFLLPLRQTV